MASIHNRKIIATLARELNERDSMIEKFEEKIVALEDQLNGLSLKMKTKTEDEDNKKECYNIIDKHRGMAARCFYRTKLRDNLD